MNILEALYFPGTTIYSASQYPLFLIVDTLHLLRPVEAADDKEATADIFISSGRCQEYTPTPLGKNRERFLHLVKDIQERKDDYAAQLSNLTLASLGEKKGSIDDSTRGIVASLLPSQQVDPAEEDQVDDILWQARLVLKIAEILDIEEEEVAMQLALLDDKQENLFQELRGELAVEEESLIEELEQLQQMMNRPSAGSAKNRLSAWTKLHLQGSEPASQFWLTHLSEAADIVLEYYENRCKKQPPVLCTFSLPANLGWSRTEANERISLFVEEAQEIRQQMVEALQATSKSELADLTKNWEAMIDERFPASTYGRSSLVMYNLTDAPVATLLGGSDNSGALLGVISSQE